LANIYIPKNSKNYCVGGGFISDNSVKVDIIKVKDNKLIHRQLEQRNGMTFMRMKIRKMPETLNS